MRSIPRCLGLLAASAMVLVGCSATVGPERALSVEPAGAPTSGCSEAFSAAVGTQEAAWEAKRAATAEIDNDEVRKDEKLERLREVNWLADKTFNKAVQETLRACEDAPDWLAGVLQQPSVVGIANEDELADDILSGACGLLEGSRVCADAQDHGIW
ncbi:hypothetical protein [Salinibacterium sp. GXW1014]|uniref:hypothetical protein n=1 Tax=Salinibacterium sp. GXW1014 TaxID=3377838 RepID=UPI00383ACEC5